MRAAQKGVDRNADAGKVLGDHRRFRGAFGNFLCGAALYEFLIKRLKAFY